MIKTPTTNIFSEDPEYDNFSFVELTEKLSGNSHVFRARAPATLVRRACQQVELLAIVEEVIMKPENVQARVIGTDTVSGIGIYCLITNGDEKLKAKALQLIEQWPTEHRYDLLDW